jgi:hypothetical protein
MVSFADIECASYQNKEIKVTKKDLIKLIIELNGRVEELESKIKKIESSSG